MVFAFLASHGRVAVAAHAYGDDVFSILGALHALAEEAVDGFLVLGIVPNAVLVAVARPFLVVARHRLVVRCAHDYAHLVGRLAVQRVVGVESPAPHRRPKEVALEAEYQFENLGVEVVAAVIGAESVFHPCREARRLVVQEYAAVTHGRLSVGVYTFIYIYALVPFDGRVGPVVPRRNANLARQLVYSVYGSAPVAAGDDDLPANGRYYIFLTFAFQGGLVDGVRLHHFVYFGGMSDGAYNYFGIGHCGGCCFRSAHFVDVGGEVVRRN